MKMETSGCGKRIKKVVIGITCVMLMLGLIIGLVMWGRFKATNAQGRGGVTVFFREK